jgi:PTH1 family peptidyl-tRNA hydrolase
MDVADYVLKKPSSEEQSKIDQAIDKALRTLPLFIKGDVQNAMQAIHGPD